jgi:hypothetical protein
MKEIFSSIFCIIMFFSELSSQTDHIIVDNKTNEIKFIKNFYTSYIETFANERDLYLMEKKLKILQKSYCTNKLLKEIPDLVEKCDCDPFLNAQDADIRILNTLKIYKVGDNNEYIVQYMDDLTNRLVKVKLKLVKIKNSWKIDSVYH